MALSRLPAAALCMLRTATLHQRAKHLPRLANLALAHCYSTSGFDQGSASRDSSVRTMSTDVPASLAIEATDTKPVKYRASKWLNLLASVMAEALVTLQQRGDAILADESKPRRRSEDELYLVNSMLLDLTWTRDYIDPVAEAATASEKDAQYYKNLAAPERRVASLVRLKTIPKAEFTVSYAIAQRRVILQHDLAYEHDTKPELRMLDVLEKLAVGTISPEEFTTKYCDLGEITLPKETPVF